MLIKEFRVVLPITVEEYQVAQLYSVAEASKNETGGGEGIEVIKNEPFEGKELLGGKYNKGQYTYKIYHLESKVPPFIRMLMPKGSLAVHEEAWNAYPYCRTVLTNPDYMAGNFTLCIETMHAPDNGTQENVHELPPEKLKIREVDVIDIASDPVLPKNRRSQRENCQGDGRRRHAGCGAGEDYKEDEDPSTFVSKKTGRGPLKGDWMKTCKPVMCAYKLVTVEFKWFGLQNRVEAFIQKTERRIFLNFHRQVFCWMDRWYGMTMADIRKLEEQTKKELDEQRKKGTVRGTKGEE